MNNIIIADTGPLIALALIDQLTILNKLFEKVYITEAVLHETTVDTSKAGAKTILTALNNQEIIKHDIDKNSDFLLELLNILDKGEAESLSLAKKLGGIALIDEKRGRNVGMKNHIKIISTAAILLKAKQSGKVLLVKPLLSKLTKSGYRLSDRLINEILKLCNE
jgi:predicted nucleic acid-binding protein